MVRTTVAVLIATSFLCGAPASAVAQDAAEQQTRGVRTIIQPEARTARTIIEPGAECWAADCVTRSTRGTTLPSLYASLIGLEVYDGYSTSRGLGKGAVEANSIMGGVASNPTALWVAKGGAAFVSIYAAERLWRRHRRAQAIAVMVATNSIMGIVAARNASVIRAQR